MQSFDVGLLEFDEIVEGPDLSAMGVAAEYQVRLVAFELFDKFWLVRQQDGFVSFVNPPICFIYIGRQQADAVAEAIGYAYKIDLEPVEGDRFIQ